MWFSYRIIALMTLAFAVSTLCSSWPEAKGMNCEEAKLHIKNEMIKVVQPENKKKIKVVVLEKGSMVTMDFNPFRVRIFCDFQNARVVSEPKTG
mmetsp:Transcript_20651/g.29880  ORF Transcript_20651/g.29880 Transcript_20651/m.29880 type:complete len:94 (-) Transcript_20651:397-678(-)